METEELVEALRKVLSGVSGVKLALLFGSFARDSPSPLSDLDFAVMGNIDEVELIMSVSRAVSLPVERIDIVRIESAPLKVLKNILRDGILIHGDEAIYRQLIFKVLTEYHELSLSQAFNSKFSLNPKGSVDAQILLDLVNNLVARSKDTEEFISEYTLEDIKRRRILDVALRWLIYESVQTMVDSCNHIVASLKLGVAETYRDSVIILTDQGLLDKGLARTIIEFISLRNRLAHRYRYVTSEELYERAKGLTESLIPKFREWIYKVIREHGA